MVHRWRIFLEKFLNDETFLNNVLSKPIESIHMSLKVDHPYLSVSQCALRLVNSTCRISLSGSLNWIHIINILLTSFFSVHTVSYGASNSVSKNYLQLVIIALRDLCMSFSWDSGHSRGSHFTEFSKCVPFWCKLCSDHWWWKQC